MPEKFPSPEPEKDIKEKRLEFIKNFLESLTSSGNKEPFGEGDFVTVLEGDYAYQGMRVLYIGAREIHLKPSPDSLEIIKYPKDKVFTMNDFKKALIKALDAYPDPEAIGFSSN